MAKTKAKRAVRITNGPWTGCFQSWDVAPNPTTELYSAFNCVFRNTQAGLAAQIRPGFANIGQLGVADATDLLTELGDVLLLETGDDLTTDGHRTPQCIYQHTRLDGTSDPFVFCGGRMYRWNADTVTPVFTDITPVAVSISTTARIFCTSIANLLIVSDGVNRPWTWDQATGTATYIQYDTAHSMWNAYGPPRVYGAKLFFIVNTVNGASQRTDIAWSEESSPATGYFQDGFDNTWTLTQTNADGLYCLMATNSALYYFRRGSIGAIYGAVASDFRTSATQDSVSLTVGTTNPASVIQAGDYIWWADSLGRPHRMRPGGSVEEVWRQMQSDADQFTAASSASIVNLERWCAAGFNVELDVVVFVLWGSVLNAPSPTLYTFDAPTGVFMGSWSINGSSVSAFGRLRDMNTREAFFVGGTDIGGGAIADGNMLTQRLFASGGNVYYQDGSGPQPQLTAYVQTRQLNDDASEEWEFDRVDVEYAGDDTGRAAFTSYLQYKTTRTAPSQQNVSVPASTTGTQHGSAGIVGRGRFITVMVGITTTTSTPVPAGFNRIQVVAFPDANDPGVP